MLEGVNYTQVKYSDTAPRSALLSARNTPLKKAEGGLSKLVCILEGIPPLDTRQSSAVS